MSGIYWLASYHKSGNTWFRAFLYNFLQNCEKPSDINSISFGGIASSKQWIDKVLGFDSSELSEDEAEQLRPDVYRWSMLSGETRYSKIHDAYNYLPDGEALVCREATLGAIYLIRNPLDVAVSFAHYSGNTIDKVIDNMGKPFYVSSTKNRASGSQVRQRMFTWSGHVASWVDAPDLKRMVIRYEDMKTMPLETFTRAVDFLELTIDHVRIEKAIRFSRFDELKAQEIEKGFRECPVQASSFFRKGVIGDWRNDLSDAQANRIISDHRDIMLRFGYLDEHGNPTT